MLINTPRFCIRAAALTRHIFHVFLVSAKKEMIGFYTKRLVACVANFQPLRYGAMHQAPSNPMRPIGESVYARTAITTSCITLTGGTNPKPTPLGFINSGAKISKGQLARAEATSGTTKSLWATRRKFSYLKRSVAQRTLACYRESSHCMNLLHRFVFGQARSLRTTAIGLLCIIALTTPVIAKTQGPRPLIPLQQSAPCPDNDNSERCQLKRAVSAALDDIANLKRQLQAAAVAIEQQEKAIKAANDAIEAGAKERAAYERTLATAEKIIAQQQGLITTFQSAIQTLQKMVEMAMTRIGELERKVDKANGRSAVLGAVLTAVSIIAVLVRK